MGLGCVLFQRAQFLRRPDDTKMGLIFGSNRGWAVYLSRRLFFIFFIFIRKRINLLINNCIKLISEYYIYQEISSESNLITAQADILP